MLISPGEACGRIGLNGADPLDLQKLFERIPPDAITGRVCDLPGDAQIPMDLLLPLRKMTEDDADNFLRDLVSVDHKYEDADCISFGKMISNQSLLGDFVIYSYFEYEKRKYEKVIVYRDIRIDEDAFLDGYPDAVSAWTSKQL